MRRLVCWCLLLCLGLPLLAQAADVQATLDRSTVSLGETVTLNLRIADAGSVSLPSLAPLRQDFDILGRSQSSNLSFVNGKRRSELVIGVVLRPRHAGSLVIPALSVAGTQTAPLTLSVLPASAAASTPRGNVFVEAEVTPKQAWVGQQLSYVVRLYYRGNLSSGTLDTPQLGGVQLDQLGKDLRYDAVRDGRNYHVVERDYALIPQHAGTLVIPALGFQGEALDPSDPNSFFGVGAPVSASAPALSVAVQAAPADWGKAAWLPARALSLTMTGWPDANTPLRVGQPINLSLRVSATGLPADALPTLSLPALQGATVYPDQPTTHSGSDGPWLVGSRERAFAVIPDQAGTLTLPAISLKWFNVLSGKLETAEIPARRLSVLPAAGVAAASPQTTASVPAATASVPAASAVAPAASAPASAPPAMPWRGIALASLLLWLLSVLAWWWLRRRRASRSVPAASPPATGSVASGPLRQAFLAAAGGDDAAAQLHHLLAWAQAERPAIRQPGELAAALAEPAQQRALAALQKRCYGGAADGPVSDLAATFKRGFAWREPAPADADGLPPLYPFKL